MIRLAGYRQLVLDLVIFDRSVRVRSEDSVDLTGIDPQSPKGCLNRPDLVVARWMGLVSEWLKPIYVEMKFQLMSGPYLQVDETPIKYLDPGNGKTAQGYLWVALLFLRFLSIILLIHWFRLWRLMYLGKILHHAHSQELSFQLVSGYHTQEPLL